MAISRAPRLTPDLIGQIAGLFAVLSWGSYFALSRAGVNDGLHLADFLILRFGVAGLLMLPLLAMRRRALLPLGLWRCVALAAAAGPLFVIAGVGGYRFTTLAHGAVIQPVTVSIVVTLAAVALMGETLSRPRLLGMLLALAGAIMVGLGGAAAQATGPAWVGDLLFVAAGLLYAAFTLMLRGWRIDPALATASISVLSAAVVLPWFLAFESFDRILALPPPTLILQLAFQGVVSGVLAVLAFGITVKHLGASRAALYPSMVPVAATLIGIPLTHELPTLVQTLGLLLATIGLLGAVLPWQQWRRRAPAGSKA